MLCFSFGNSVANQTVLWYRAAELKHSRVAMLATAGWIVNALGVSFPGELPQAGLTFSSLSHNPLEAWAAVPETLKYRLLGVIGLIEILTETAKVGRYPWPVLQFSIPSFT